MKYRLPAGLSGPLLIRHLLMLISVAERTAPTPLPHLCTVVVSKTRRPFLMVLRLFLAWSGVSNIISKEKIGQYFDNLLKPNPYTCLHNNLKIM